jgi:lysophospholipase L1-like esterase
MAKDTLLTLTAQNALDSIKNLSTTATEADLNSGNYMVVGTSDGPKKLPGDVIVSKSMLDEIVNVLENYKKIESSGTPLSYVDIDDISCGKYYVTARWNGSGCNISLICYNAGTAIKTVQVVDDDEVVSVVDLDVDFDEVKLYVSSSNTASDIVVVLKNGNGLIPEVDKVEDNCAKINKLADVVPFMLLGGKTISYDLDGLEKGGYITKSFKWEGSPCNVNLVTYLNGSVSEVIELVKNNVAKDFFNVTQNFDAVQLWCSSFNAATNISGFIIKESSVLLKDYEDNVELLNSSVGVVTATSKGAYDDAVLPTLTPGMYDIEKITYEGGTCNCNIVTKNNGVVVSAIPIISNNVAVDSFTLSGTYDEVLFSPTSSNTAKNISVYISKNGGLDVFTTIESLRSLINVYSTRGGVGTFVPIAVLPVGTYRIKSVDWIGVGAYVNIACYKNNTLKKGLTIVSNDVKQAYINVDDSYDEMKVYCTSANTATDIRFSLEQVNKFEALSTIVDKPIDFTGKKLLLVGDSIALGYIGQGVTITDNYINLFKDKCGALSVDNFAEGGATFVYREGSEIRSIKEQLQYANTQGKLATADIIFVNAGTNDYANQFSLSDFTNAVAEVLTYVNSNKKTGAKVIFVTPYNRTKYYETETRPLNDYRLAITQAALYESDSVIDGSKAGMPNSIDSYSKTMMPDGIHPNENGHKIIANYLSTVLL